MRQKLCARYNAVKIQAPVRVHFGLASLTAESSRAFGGAGLSIWHTPAVVTARRIGGDARLLCANKELYEYLYHHFSIATLNDVEVEIAQAPAAHVGLGSKTSVAMAVSEALSLLLCLDLGRNDIARRSGRGGASGIGVNAYFEGGLVVDAGHRGPLTSFHPSSAGSPNGIPKVLTRVAWPREWSIWLVRLPGRGASAHRERQFFSDNTPISRGECALAAMSLLFEIPASVADVDFPGFRHALLMSRRHGMKALEVSANPLAARVLSNIQADSDLAGTMSSFGPTLVVVSRNGVDLRQPAVASRLEMDGFDVHESAPSDFGRMIEFS